MTLGWPPELPQNFLSDLSTEPNSNIEMTEMEVGEPQFRLKDSVAFDTHTGQIIVTNAEAARFFDFYRNEHLEGAEPFGWVDPYTGQAKKYCIKPVPTRTNLGGGYSRINFTVVEMPS